ncbi:peptidoglycan DD-metalloendopeptidase family protein [Pedobacter sp. SD-b]|uniref:Peptidoglycan DD-metalloendopeptidase family protein n=1 Tax=Pedobacter segetis TaxID=2793069 RepID=A0ABS1BIM7_9SPHI|nr:peptidoglycan DD-metalloendopeptidase family protein [Pedobacter segetis]MBK0382710.1 peptidoglycan DD-metalloendopeptidase family protein [Pedobacter segetis]
MKYFKSILILLLVFLGAQTFAQSRSELEKRKAQLNKDIEMTNNILNKTSKDKKVTLKQLNLLRAQIRLKEEKINTINSEIRLLDGQINDNVNQVRSLQAQLTQLKKDYAAMIRFAQKNQGSYSKLMYIFAAKDFNQAYKRMKYLQQFGEYRQKQAKYIEDTQNAIKNKLAQLNRNKLDKDHLLNDQEKEKNTLGTAQQKQAKAVSSLTSQEKKLKQDLAKKQRDAQKLDRAIKQAIAREIEIARKKAEEEARIAAAKAKAEGKEAPAAKTGSYLNATPEAAKLSADFVNNRGRLPWPVASGVVTQYAGREKYGVNVVVENTGWKLRTNAGGNIRAVFEGTVTLITDVAGSTTVLVRHGQYFTAYVNLATVSVSKNQKISTKQVIGTAGSDGDFEFHLYKSDNSLVEQDPKYWLAPN